MSEVRVDFLQTRPGVWTTDPLPLREEPPPGSARSPLPHAHARPWRTLAPGEGAGR